MSRVLFIILVTAAATALSVLFVVQDGASWRIPDDRIYPSPYTMREWESALCNGTDRDGEVQLGGQPGEPLITCESDIGSDKNIYVWGDSHARHLLPGLRKRYDQHNIRIMYYSSCLPQSGYSGFYYNYEGKSALAKGCEERNFEAIRYFQNIKSSLIILHQYFGYEEQFHHNWNSATDFVIGRLKELGHSVAFIGGVPRPDIELANCLTVPPLISNNRLSIRCRGDQSVGEEIRSQNRELAALFPDHFVDVSDFFCSNETGCSATQGAMLLFRDKHHLTTAGSEAMISFIGDDLDRFLPSD